MTPRRSILAAMTFGAITAIAPLPSAAQQQLGKVPRIGILSPAEQPSTKVFDAFRKGLRALGYIEGRNITIEYRLAGGNIGRLPALAGELARLPVDVMVTDALKSAQAAREAAPTIPIVMAAGPADPVAAGLVQSFAHPGGNVTGFIFQPAELGGKRLQLLKDAFPTVSRIAALWNPAGFALALRATEEAARTLGVQLRTINIATPDQIGAGFEMAVAGDADGLDVLPDAMFWNNRAQIVAPSAKSRLPAIYPEREYADDGGLLAYGAEATDSFRQAAGYVEKILKGTKPGDLPIQQPTRFALVVNLKTARALGLTIPPPILARADEVIE